MHSWTNLALAAACIYPALADLFYRMSGEIKDPDHNTPTIQKRPINTNSQPIQPPPTSTPSNE